MRKRKWLPEYKCDKLSTFIVKKIAWCGENRINCNECPFNKGYKNDEEINKKDGK